MKSYEKGMITRIIWGSKSADRIAGELKNMDVKRCMIVSGSHVIHHPITEKVIQDLKEDQIEVVIFDRVRPEPEDTVCLEIAKEIKEKKIDAVLGIGGGSPMDAAKAAALIAGIDEEIEDLHEYGKTGTRMQEKWTRPCKLILVPTTSGTGAETTASGVITSTKHHLKFSFGNRNIAPDLAVIDPEFTLGMPKMPTVYGGLDALAHSVEIIVGTAANEYSNTILLKCVEKVWKWLKISVEEPDNLEAREQLSWAAHNALANGGVPNGHAVAHAIGAGYHIVHGHACAMVLPTVIRHFSESSPKEIADLAGVMGVKVDTDPKVTADLVADAILDFYKSFGLGTLTETLKEQGIEEEKEAFVKKMIPMILDDFKSREWLPPIHTGDYNEKVGKVCRMIWEE